MMQTSEKIDELSAALCDAQSEFTQPGKSGDNKFDHYKYTTTTDLIRAYREPLHKHGLSLVVSPAEEILEVGTLKSKKGDEQPQIRVKCVARLLHKSGQWIETEAIGEGVDRSDKSTNKAMTAGRKYAIQCLLGLYGDESEDADLESPERAPSAPASRDEKAVDHAAEHKARMAAIAKEMKDYVATKPREFTPAEMKALFRDAGSDLAAWKKLIDSACESFAPAQEASDDDDF